MRKPVRRWAFVMLLPALGLLASCGIPTTGVVGAGVPASGVVPTIRVYYVAGGALRGVSRRIAAPVDVESAVQVLLKGPTQNERTEGLITLLPVEVAAPSALPPTPPPTLAPRAAHGSKWVQVTSRRDRVDIRLTVPRGGKTGLAAAQLICTADAAQRVGAPGTDPLPVTVTDPDGREIRASDITCPD